MAKTETGWTTTAPNVNGMYWWRAGEEDYEPEMHEIADDKVYRMESRRSEPVKNYGGQWLGPISPSDFEQLTRLRDWKESAMTLLSRYDSIAETFGGKPGSSKVDNLERGVKQLRAQPSVSDAIEEVERLYDEWWDVDRRRCLNVVLERLKALQGREALAHRRTGE